MPKLSKPPDPNDPEYQQLERRVNFTLHVSIFFAVNTGMWFVRSVMYADWEWTLWTSSLWAMALVSHGAWVWAKNR
ncbi:MAG: 2TM domain-containing protein [Pseudanabaenaceae cyanobacterium]|jgi:hypothetical protein